MKIYVSVDMEGISGVFGWEQTGRDEKGNEYEKALADHITLRINEGWTDREIEDTINALQKVEKAYLKL